MKKDYHVQQDKNNAYFGIGDTVSVKTENGDYATGVISNIEIRKEKDSNYPGLHTLIDMDVSEDGYKKGTIVSFWIENIQELEIVKFKGEEKEKARQRKECIKEIMKIKKGFHMCDVSKVSTKGIHLKSWNVDIPKRDIDEITSLLLSDDYDITGFELFEIPHPKVFCFINVEKEQCFDVVKLWDNKWQFSYLKNQKNYPAKTIVEAIEKFEKYFESKQDKKEYTREICKKCIDWQICQNTDKEVCIMELQPKDVIQFKDTNCNKVYTATIKKITDTLNLVFEEDWGINGIFVTDIKILQRKQQ